MSQNGAPRTSTALGRLERVSLRAVWLSEPAHFTPWLAADQNMALLADTLGIDMECEGQEQGVGPFRADIVCRNTGDGSLVLIENQLERTDHTHLGQLMTYAAGLDAVTIVWIAERFTEEHRAALDWLNEITNERARFFGLEIELWRIGSSPVAPKFNVVCEPNNWIKSSAGRVGPGGGGEDGITETQALQQEYWRTLTGVLDARGSRLKPQAPRPQHWLIVSIGRSHFHLNALATSRETIGVDLYIGGPLAKRHFHKLKQDQAAIEQELGAQLDWRELPHRDASRIVWLRRGPDLRDRQAWPEQHQWLADSLEQMDRVFRPRVLALPSEYESDLETTAEL